MIYTEDVGEAVADADIIYTDMWLALPEKSMVFDQTENRIPAVKAILYSTLRLDPSLDLKLL